VSHPTLGDRYDGHQSWKAECEHLPDETGRIHGTKLPPAKVTSAVCRERRCERALSWQGERPFSVLSLVQPKN
jgi:hypothetical protein